MREITEMAPIAVVARVVPAVAKPAPLSTSLAAKLASSIQGKEYFDDEECYEDEQGNIKMCKKCEQKSSNFTGNYNKYNMQERANLVNFLKQLNEKNYAAAHKYLKKIMEFKLAARIAKNKNLKVF